MATHELSPMTMNKGYWMSSWYDRRGKRRWKSFGSVKKVTKREAEQRRRDFCREWYASSQIRDKVDSTGLTVSELADRYHVFAREHYRKRDGTPSGQAANMLHAMRELTDLCGDTKVADLMAMDVRECREIMIEKGLSRTTVNGRINRIRHIFKWGAGRDIVPPDIFNKLRAIEPLRAGRSKAREPKRRRPLDRSVIDRTLPHLPAPVAAMVELQWLTGMRPGEAMRMRGCDLDTSGDVWVYTPDGHKTEHYGKERTIYLGPGAKRIVEQFLKRGMSDYLFSPREAVAAMHGSRGGKSRKKAIHYTWHCDRYRANYYRQAIHRACDKVGVDRWTPYDLRHTAATRLRRDHGEEVARIILGHSRIDTTQMYGEVDRGKAISVAATSC